MNEKRPIRLGRGRFIWPEALNVTGSIAATVSLPDFLKGGGRE